MDARPPRRRWSPRARDAALRRTRHITRLIAAAAAGGAALFSVVAAHAFKGHARTTTAVRATARAEVPGPQRVPGIAGAPAPAPLPAPPPPPPPQPQPVVSGGS